MDRITRDEMLAEILATVAKRSTCNRRHVGAILTLEGRILSMGYAGSPAGTPHCTDVGCLIDPKGGGCIRTQHAEANAIAWAARKGISTENSILWCSLSPCLSCAKLIINSGVREVVFIETYRDSSGLDLLSTGGVKWRLYEKP